MFNWTPEEKEHYYRIAESRIKRAGLSKVLKIDRQQFGVNHGITAKIYLRPLIKKGNQENWNRAKHRISGFKEIKFNFINKNRDREEIYYKGYIEITMRG